MHRCFIAMTSLLILALFSEQNFPVAAADSEQGSTPDLQPSPVSCHLEDLIIYGTDINPNYVHPSWLNIGQCVGTCSEESASSGTPYHHQLVRTGHYRGSCCVPTKIAPVTFFEVDHTGRTKISLLQKLIVTECGCY